MQRLDSTRGATIARGLALAAALAAAAGMPASAAIERRVLLTHDGVEIPYALVVPDDRATPAPWPALLALPPGAQDAAMVDWALDRYWGADAADAGWLVVCPEAPPAGWDAPTGKRYALDLMREVARRFRIEGDRFHLAGVSNGGGAAFHLALDLSDRFASLTVLPGMPRGRLDFGRLERLGRLPVTMYVGENDPGWLAGARRTADRLRRIAAPVRLVVVADEGHVIDSLAGGALFEALDERRPGAAPTAALAPTDEAAASSDPAR